MPPYEAPGVAPTTRYSRSASRKVSVNWTHKRIAVRPQLTDHAPPMPVGSHATVRPANASTAVSPSAVPRVRFRTTRSSVRAEWDGAAGWRTSTVRRESLATILPLVEDGLLKHDNADDIDLTELEAALADLHTAMSRHHNETNGDTK